MLSHEELALALEDPDHGEPAPVDGDLLVDGVEVREERVHDVRAEDRHLGAAVDVEAGEEAAASR